MELKCKVSRPEFQVQWLRNGNVIENGSRYELLSQDTERLLLIRNPTRLDNGDYICQSADKQQRVVLTLNVNVNDGLISDVKSVYTSSDDDASTAVFVTNRHLYNRSQPELTYYSNETGTLRCQVKQSSEQVFWWKDNHCIDHLNKKNCSDDEKYAMIDQGTSRSLLIKVNELINFKKIRSKCRIERKTLSFKSFVK